MTIFCQVFSIVYLSSDDPQIPTVSSPECLLRRQFADDEQLFNDSMQLRQLSNGDSAEQKCLRKLRHSKKSMQTSKADLVKFLPFTCLLGRIKSKVK